MIGESIAFLNKQTTLQMQQILFPLKLKLEQGKSYSESKLDVLAAANLALKMLDGPSTKERRLVLKLALHMIFQMVFKPFYQHIFLSQNRPPNKQKIFLSQNHSPNKQI